MYYIQHCFICRPLDSTCWRLGWNPELSDALTTQPKDLFRNLLYTCTYFLRIQQTACIRIREPDPNRDHPGHADTDPADQGRYNVQTNENFIIGPKILKIIAHLTLMRKIKLCKLTLLCKKMF